MDLKLNEVFCAQVVKAITSSFSCLSWVQNGETSSGNEKESNDIVLCSP